MKKLFKTNARANALPLITAGPLPVFCIACSQNDEYEDYVLNGDGVSTLAKRSMMQGGESVTPPGPKYESTSITLESILPDSLGRHDSFTAGVTFTLEWKNGNPKVQMSGFTAPDGYFVDGFGIRPDAVEGHYFYTCSGHAYDTIGAEISYYGEQQVLLSPEN